MIFDFKKNRLVFMVGLLGTLILSIILLQLNINADTVFIVSAILALLIWFTLRRLTVQEVQQLQVKFMLECNPVVFKDAYIKLINNRFSYDKRWAITKHQNVVLGAIFSGDQATAETVLKTTEARFNTIISKQPVYRYSHAVTHALYAAFYLDRGDFLEKLDQVSVAYEGLPGNAKKTIENNLNGFHYWFKLVSDHLLIESPNPNEFVNKLSELSPFFKISGYYLLQRMHITGYEDKLLPESEHAMFSQTTLKTF